MTGLLGLLAGLMPASLLLAGLLSALLLARLLSALLLLTWFLLTRVLLTRVLLTGILRVLTHAGLRMTPFPKIKTYSPTWFRDGGLRAAMVSTSLPWRAQKPSKHDYKQLIYKDNFGRRRKVTQHHNMIPLCASYLLIGNGISTLSAHA